MAAERQLEFGWRPGRPVGHARRMPGRGRRTLGTQAPHLAERLGGGPVGNRAPAAVRQGGGFM